MDIYHIILKKRNGQKLTSQEIGYLVNSYSKDKIPAYQMSAFLMAVYFKGLTSSETLSLTQVMINSGKTLNLSSLKKPCIDKHSTGGVGDKISLILAPLVASCGIVVPMIAGRGLGHTGGTLDKLESIPGFNTQLSAKRFKKQLSRIGIAIIGQTKEIAPADKKLYALRDVTATVESIPLISASIMSKKMAEGINGLVLDIKTGNGAFMKNTKEATRLAKTMISIGKGMNKKIRAILTNMNEPLGFTIGNALEVKESIDTLLGHGPKDIEELTCTLAAHMLLLGKKVKTIAEGKKLALKKLNSKEAYNKFIDFVKAQGGNVSYIKNQKKFKTAKIKKTIYAKKSGYITNVDSQELGLCSTLLGAGRITLNSPIDHSAGIILKHKVGDKVKKGTPLAILHTNISPDKIAKRVETAFVIGTKRTKKEPLIFKIIK